MQTQKKQLPGFAAYRSFSSKFKFHIYGPLLFFLAAIAHFMAYRIPDLLCASSVAEYFIWFYIGVLLNRYETHYQRIITNPGILVLFLIGFGYHMGLVLKYLLHFLLFCSSMGCRLRWMHQLLPRHGLSSKRKMALVCIFFIQCSSMYSSFDSQLFPVIHYYYVWRFLYFLTEYHMFYRRFLENHHSPFW